MRVSAGLAEASLALAVGVALAASIASGAALSRTAGEPGASRARPARPARIVSLSLPADEIAVALVRPERIAGLSFYARDPLASNVAGAAAGLPSVAPRAESLLARGPDLLIAPFYLAPETTALVRDAGVPICGVGHATSFEEVRAQIRAIGRCLGETDGAEALVRAMDARLERTGARVRGRARPRVLLYDASGTTAGRDTLFDAVIDAAGGRNAARDHRGHAPLPLASLLRLDPDVIVLHRYVAESRARELVPEPPFERDARFAELRAVREHRVVRIESRLVSTTSHHAAGAVEALARALHPESAREGRP